MPIFDKLKRTLTDPLKKVRDVVAPPSAPTPATPTPEKPVTVRPPIEAPRWIPPEVQDKYDSAQPKHEYYNFATLIGDVNKGDSQGALAIADGKSGDVNRFPLPQDLNDPKAKWFENGTTCTVKSIGEHSVLVELEDYSPKPQPRRKPRFDAEGRELPPKPAPTTVRYHFKHENVNQLKPSKTREHPTQRWTRPVDVSKPLEVTPDTKPLVDDLYDPKMPPRKSSITVRAIELWPEHGDPRSVDALQHPGDSYHIPVKRVRDDLANYKRMKVPVSKLRSTQQMVFEKNLSGSMEALARGSLPLLIEQANGTYLVDDGNHRAVAQILQGATEIEGLVLPFATSHQLSASTHRAEQFMSKSVTINATTTHTAGKPSYCNHCGKQSIPPGEIFGEEGKWFHRGCTRRGPMKSASVRVRATNMTTFAALKPGALFMTPVLQRQYVLEKVDAHSAMTKDGMTFGFTPDTIVMPLELTNAPRAASVVVRAKQPELAPSEVMPEPLPDDVGFDGMVDLGYGLPVIEPGEGWNLRPDPKNPNFLIDITTGQRMRKDRKNMPASPEFPSLAGPKERAEWEEKLMPLLPDQHLERWRQWNNRAKTKPGATPGEFDPKLPEDLYKPTREIPPPSEAKVGKDIQVKEDGGLQNIVNVLKAARPDEVNYWKHWYIYAADDARALAEKYNVPMKLASALIAILSPNTPWEQNVLAAEMMLKGQGRKVIDYRKKVDDEAAGNMMAKLFPSLYVKPETLGSGSYLNNIQKAQNLLDGWEQHGVFDSRAGDELQVEWGKAAPEKRREPTDKRQGDETVYASPDMARRYVYDALKRGYTVYSTKGTTWARERPMTLEDVQKEGLPANGRAVLSPPISGPKVTAFYESIVDPDQAAKKVVLDGHAQNIWYGVAQPLNDMDVSTPPEQLRNQMVSDYEKAAAMSPELVGQQLTPQQVQAITWSVWREAVSGEKRQKKQRDKSKPKSKRQPRAGVKLASVLVGRGRNDHPATTVAVGEGQVAPHGLELNAHDPRRAGADNTRLEEMVLDGRGRRPGVVEQVVDDGVRHVASSVHEGSVRLSASVVKRALSPLGMGEMQRYMTLPEEFSVMSAYQQDASKSENKKAHGALLEDLQSMGFRPKQTRVLRGQYEYTDPQTGQKEMRAEMSVLIFDMPLEAALKLASKYGQESVLHKSTEGVVGAYHVSGKANTSHKDGLPNFGENTVSVDPRQPKPVPGGGPSPNDPWSKARGNGFTFDLDWDTDIGPHDGRPISRQDVTTRLQRARMPKVPNVTPQVQSPTKAASGASGRRGDGLSRKIANGRVYTHVLPHPDISGAWREWSRYQSGAGDRDGDVDESGDAERPIRVRAPRPKAVGLVLPRTGFRQYEGEHEGRRVKVRAEDIIAKGTFPGNRRQKRQTLWKVSVDGDDVGEAPTLREAKELAVKHCGAKKASVRVRAGVVRAAKIQVVDAEGKVGSTNLDLVRKGDRVKFREPFEFTAHGKFEVDKDVVADVERVDATTPALEVTAMVFAAKRESGITGKRMTFIVPPEAVAVIMSTDDPRG